METIQPLVLIGAPSGGGKTTSVERITALRPDIIRVVTSTTRQPRTGEKNGIHYHFYSPARFRKMNEEQKFIEIDTFSGNQYGTEWKALTDIWESGKVPIAAITLPGIAAVKGKYPHALTIFIRPHKIEELEGRIRKRDSDISLTVLRKRMDTAKVEIETAHIPCRHIIVAPDGSLDDLIESMCWLINGYLKKDIFKSLI